MRISSAPPLTPVLRTPVVAAVASVAPARVTVPAQATLALAASKPPGFGHKLMRWLAGIPGIHQIGVWFFALQSRPKPTDPPLDNVGQVAPTLLRGAQPTDAGFAQLRAQGVTTVINLREERQAEQGAVRALGMTYLPMPITPVGPPTIAQGEAFLSAVTDPANGKVFVHCYHGADRTGAMIAIYRIAVDGWPVERALAELPAYRFNEQREQDKVDFVRAFASHWAAQPAAARAKVLHTAG